MRPAPQQVSDGVTGLGVLSVTRGAATNSPDPLTSENKSH